MRPVNWARRSYHGSGHTIGSGSSQAWRRRCRLSLELLRDLWTERMDESSGVGGPRERLLEAELVGSREKSRFLVQLFSPSCLNFEV